MSTTPTLTPERTDQLRTFLVVEAASSTAAGTPARRAPRRRLALGVATVALLAGGLVAAQAVGGPAPAAIAVEVDGGWTTVRLTDIDADPDAVVADLRDAGFRAEHRPFRVERSGDSVMIGEGIDGDEVEGSVVVSDAEDIGPSVAGVVGDGSGEGGEHGVVGLSVSLPEGALPPVDDQAMAEAVAGGQAGSGSAGNGPADAALEEAGIRFEADGGVSFRQGVDVTIVVQTEA